MGAQVRIDGSVKCATPCITSLPSGPHQLELVFPDGPFGRAIDLGPGEPNSFTYNVPAASWSVVVANLTQ